MNEDFDTRLENADKQIFEILNGLDTCLKELKEKYNANEKKTENEDQMQEFIDMLDQDKLEEEKEKQFYKSLENLYLKIDQSHKIFQENIENLPDEQEEVPSNPEFENFVYSIDNLYIQEKIGAFLEEKNKKIEQFQNGKHQLQIKSPKELPINGQQIQELQHQQSNLSEQHSMYGQQTQQQQYPQQQQQSQISQFNDNQFEQQQQQSQQHQPQQRSQFSYQNQYQDYN